MTERDTKEILKRIRKIEIVTNRLVNEQLAGSYHSVFKGQGMDFDDVRLYQPGDDVRNIDWNVSARANEAYIKTYVEEREMTVMLMVDVSGDGKFGSRSQVKADVAAEVGALLAFSAIKNNDRVGLVLFTDTVEHFVPPKKGKSHVLRVIRDILTYDPMSSGKRIEAGVEFMGRVTRRKSVGFLLSDFYADGYEASLRVARRRHDIIPVVVTDPLESELASAGLVAFEDPKTGEVIWHNTNRGFLSWFRDQTKKRREERERAFRRMNLDFINLQTGEPYTTALMKYFRLRARRH
ncbi:MAG: DUF58 domain-containing protein [Myxococcota bacterium]|nr:DUF58 domain-containing protein [Myxococcota bacterium]